MLTEDERARWRVVLLTSCAMLAGAPGWVGATAATQLDTTEIIVRGQRGSAVATVEPLATLNSDDLGATGATTISELLRLAIPAATA